MAFIRPRSRVTLHSGGATVKNKRLTGVRASERATAPGKDIRDIGPDRGPKRCRVCSKPVGRLRGVHCESCLSDQKLIKEVRAELKRLGLPRLGVAVPKGSPMLKKRKQAEAALQRLGKATTLARSGVLRQVPKTRVDRARDLKAKTLTCPTCFVALPTTGRCDDCA